jgi:hypothetical protein
MSPGSSHTERVELLRGGILRGLAGKTLVGVCKRRQRKASHLEVRHARIRCRAAAKNAKVAVGVQ